MKRIRCQRATYRDCKRNGCDTCHGYGYVLIPFKCSTCSRAGYTRPGVNTIYEGKRYTSFDGIRGSYANHGWRCDECLPI